MAIIQSLPIATSKVIAASFNATETSSKQLQVMDTGKHFYTSDTDAWLQIGITDIDLTGTQADLTLINTSEGSSGSVITQIVDAVSYQDNNCFLFDFSKEITVNEVTDKPILHAGTWLGQAYIKKAGENITACRFKFTVEGHILDQKESALVAVQNVNTLVNTLDGMITDLQEDVDMIQAAEQLRIALYNEIQTKYLNGDFVGAQGIPGVDGLSSYDVAVNNGYTGTESEWIASISMVPTTLTSNAGKVLTVNDTEDALVFENPFYTEGGVLVEDFESPTAVIPILTDTFTRTVGGVNASAYCLSSTYTALQETAEFTLNVSHDGELRFWYKCQLEYFEYANPYVVLDGVTIKSAIRNTEWLEFVITISKGSHKLKFYSGSESGFKSRLYLDNISMPGTLTYKHSIGDHDGIPFVIGDSGNVLTVNSSADALVYENPFYVEGGQLIEDFELGYPLIERSGNWTVSGAAHYSGTSFLRVPVSLARYSTNIETFTFTNDEAGLLSFKYIMNDNANGQLKAYLDNILLLTDNYKTTFQSFSTNLSIGSHTLRFEYYLNYSGGANDIAGVDYISIPAGKIYKHSITEHAGVPSLTGNAGKVLTVSESETGITYADLVGVLPSPVEIPTLIGADGFIVAYDEVNNVFYLKKDDGGGGMVVMTISGPFSQDALLLDIMDNSHIIKPT